MLTPNFDRYSTPLDRLPPGYLHNYHQALALDSPKTRLDLSKPWSSRHSIFSGTIILSVQQVSKPSIQSKKSLYYIHAR